MQEKEYLEKCFEVLNSFNVRYDADTINLNSGDYGCILNPNFKYYDLFGGESIYSIAEYVAKKTNKKIIMENENY